MCPRGAIPRDWPAIVGLFGHYQDGHLWTGGGVRDQPAIYLDLMDLIATWVKKLDD